MTFYPVHATNGVAELSDLPTPSAGDAALRLFYDIRGTVLEYNIVGDAGRATVTFKGCLLHHLGWPNDEVRQVHPLVNYGLGQYGAYEVSNSGWLQSVKAGNSSHPRQTSANHDRFRHFIVVLQDETFECLAERYDWSVDPDGAL